MTKFNAYGTINKHKTKLVVKRYVQQSVVDYGGTFAQLSRHVAFRLLLVLASQKVWKVYRLDVKFTFLNGYLQEKVCKTSQRFCCSWKGRQSLQVA